MFRKMTAAFASAAVSVAVSAAAALALAGCSTTLVRDRPEAVRFRSLAPIETAPLAEALLDVEGVRAQAIEGAWKDNAFAAEVVMKGDGERFTAVFLAPQMRLATLTLARPHSIRFERAPQIPRSFEPEYLLADLAFINLETDVLRRALGAGAAVSDDGRVRRVSSADGAPIAELARSEDGSLRYRNLVYGYDYAIRSIAQE